jgi:hypothetical protein
MFARLLLVAPAVALIIGIARSQVVLNEVLANPDAEPVEEWAELYNVGTEEVDLGGWSLSDSNGHGSSESVTLDLGTTIAAGEHLVVVLQANDGLLDNDGDGVELYNTNGELVDEVTWTTARADLSQARVPDGGPWSSAPTAPTRGETNRVLACLVPANHSGYVVDTAHGLGANLGLPDLGLPYLATTVGDLNITCSPTYRGYAVAACAISSGVETIAREMIGNDGLSGNLKYSGLVLAASGLLYGIPRQATEVLVVDPVAASTTVIIGGSTTSDSLAGNDKWFGGVLAPTGTIYGAFVYQHARLYFTHHFVACRTAA